MLKLKGIAKDKFFFSFSL